MKTLELTAAQYLKAIELGIYEEVEQVSTLERVVIHYKLCGRTENILIKLND